MVCELQCSCGHSRLLHSDRVAQRWQWRRSCDWLKDGGHDEEKALSYNTLVVSEKEAQK
ncbi:hypothetical protein HanIR_Chr09g0412311 [Helianthus annuus]|nr:hypothetical protein HanIR_Chr09g0412311 [Helianthus annuus]